jgi:hypothetical protein
MHISKENLRVFVVGNKYATSYKSRFTTAQRVIRWHTTTLHRQRRAIRLPPERLRVNTASMPNLRSNLPIHKTNISKEELGGVHEQGLLCPEITSPEKTMKGDVQR